MTDIRLEGQDPDEVPLYQTEPQGPSYFDPANGMEVRVENGTPWIRTNPYELWRRMLEAGQ